jgi:hypothetical protein
MLGLRTALRKQGEPDLELDADVSAVIAFGDERPPWYGVPKRLRRVVEQTRAPSLGACRVYPTCDDERIGRKAERNRFDEVESLVRLLGFSLTRDGQRASWVA